MTASADTELAHSAPAMAACANLRCSKLFPRGTGAAKAKRFCCSACRVEWHNLLKSALLPALDKLVEYHAACRWSKSERAKRYAVRRKTGTPMPPARKPWLLNDANKIIYDFIRDEKARREAAE